MNFRYFDPEGRPLTWEELRSLSLLTPAMGHVFATVRQRVEKPGKPAARLETGSRE